MALRYKAVIFDIDGTLLDSVDLHAKAWIDAFSDYGFSLGFSDVRRQIGKGGDQLLPVFLTAQEIANFGQKLQVHRSEVLKDRYLQLMKPFAGVRDLLLRIRGDQGQVALASSAKKNEITIYKRLLNIEDIVDVETCSDDVESSKPRPDIFDAVAGQLPNLERSALIAVGDTPYDAEAANRAGIETIGLLCGGWSEPELRDAGCVAVYANPVDLLARYESWMTEKDN